VSEQKIEPALSADLWAMPFDAFGRRYISLGESLVRLGKDGSFAVNYDGAVYDSELQSLTVEDRRGLIALSNAALPDDHPAKITREWVTQLREWAYNATESDYSSQLNPHVARTMADALESYLPPEIA
jgi:hypothetical protein